MPESRPGGTENTAIVGSIEVERVDQTLAALAWQNFLKRLSQGVSEFDARAMLVQQLAQESTEAAVKRPRVDPHKIPLLDSDVGRSVAELQEYLVDKLRPQNSYLVLTPWEGLDNQRVAEVATMRWKPSDEVRHREGMAELSNLEGENIKLYYGLLELINRGLSDDDKRERLEACQEQINETVMAVRQSRTLSITDPDYFVKASMVLRAANRRLVQIKGVVEKILQERP